MIKNMAFYEFNYLENEPLFDLRQHKDCQVTLSYKYQDFRNYYTRALSKDLFDYKDRKS